MQDEEPKEQEQKSEPELPEKPTPEQLARAESLLQQASLARIRGQGSVAERLLKEAAEVAPGSAAVRAALADELWKRSQFRKARDEYKTAHLLEPENALYETKWAESIIGSSGDPLAMLSAGTENYASAKTAAFLSIMLPGLGQLVSGDRNNGIAMMVMWVGGWGWAAAVPNGLNGFFHLFGQKTHVDSFNPIVLVPLAIVALAWLWAVMSANSKAKTAVPRSIERPKPPGEGGFEV